MGNSRIWGEYVAKDWLTADNDDALKDAKSPCSKDIQEELLTSQYLPQYLYVFNILYQQCQTLQWSDRELSCCASSDNIAHLCHILTFITSLFILFYYIFTGTSTLLQPAATVCLLLITGVFHVYCRLNVNNASFGQ